jgi:hypothetical protein
MFRNYMPARQICDQLRRFISIFENPTAHPETIVNQTMSDTGFILLKLKEQLVHEARWCPHSSAQLPVCRHFGSFANDFISRQNSGTELLMRTLALLQRSLVAGTQSRLNLMLARSMNSRRRKAAVGRYYVGYDFMLQVAEADCLECVKIVLERTNSWAYILDYGGNLEIILYSLNSPQLDSKCYALEVSGQESEIHLDTHNTDCHNATAATVQFPVTST